MAIVGTVVASDTGWNSLLGFVLLWSGKDKQVEIPVSHSINRCNGNSFVALLLQTEGVCCHRQALGKNEQGAFYFSLAAT
jgi:hypothetical protein